MSDIIIDTGTIGFLAPGTRAEIFRVDNSGRQPIGWFGRVSQDIQEVYDFPNSVFLGQFDLEAVADICRIGQSYSRMSSYPRVSRDLSFSLPEGESGKKIDFRTIYETIVGTGVEEIADVRLIDLYSGKETGGRASMTVRVVYQSLDRTLIQDEIERFHARVRDSLAQRGVEFR